MKWVKRGLIFDPQQHKLPVSSVGFAQSPQALVLEDRVRVYFSTRERDSTGKYLSHVAFADFDRSMRETIAVSRERVIELGGLGCFDEHGIFPFSVFRDGSRIVAYTTGWNRKVSVSADAAIGLAISHDDGATFERLGTGPVMASALNEPFLVGDAFVLKRDAIYHMWYIFGLQWKAESADVPPDRVYKIASAHSADGVLWNRDGKCIIPDRLGSDECQALPTVFFRDGRYHMYFCYRASHGFRDDSEKGYRIGYASSVDMANWERDDTKAGITVSKEGWDSRMQCYPHVFECNGVTYMLYNGNEFGRYGFGLAVLE